MKLMIVEDSTSMRKVLRTMLRGLGYDNVHEAEDGAEAWELLRGGGFDLLISDWNMPNMSGLELLEQVRSHAATESLPVIMATSRTEKDDVIAAMKAGANNYISKPFNPPQLQAKITKVMESHAQKKSEQHTQALEKILLGSSSLEASMGAVLPFVIFVEQSTDLTVLSAPEHQGNADLLRLKLDVFHKINKEHAGGQMAYLVEDSAQDVMKVVRRARDVIQLIAIEDDIEGGGATLARLALINHTASCRVLLFVNSMSEFSVTQRAAMKKMGIALLEKKLVNEDTLTEVFVEHIPMIATMSAAEELVQVAGTAANPADAVDEWSLDSEEEADNASPHGASSVEDAMGSNENLPRLPLFFNRLQKLMRDPSENLAIWTEMVEMDARCEDMVVDRARAATTNTRNPVEDATRAVGLLGKPEVRDLAAAVALYNVAENAFEDAQLLAGFWRHSVASGIVARMLTMPFDGSKLSEYQQHFLDEWRPEGQVVALLKQFNLTGRFELGDGEIPFFAGLMHDIGHLAVASSLPRQFEKALNIMATRNFQVSFHAVEAEMEVEAGHASAGAILASNWRLDASLIRSIKAHHQPEQGDHHACLTAASDFIAGAVDTFPQEAVFPHAVLVEGLAGAMSPVVKLTPEDRKQLTEYFVPSQALEHMNMSLERAIGLTAILAPSIKRMSSRFVRGMAKAAAKRASS